MKASKLEFNKDGLLVDNVLYGLDISKVEIEDINTIKVYTNSNFWEKKNNQFENMHSAKELMKYENIIIIDTRQVGD